MSNCNFCNIDNSKFYNIIFEETSNFFIIPTIGSLVDGYILIISKKHIYNMLQLNNNIKLEYLSLINKYRLLFKKIYGIYPIIFEHGSTKNSDGANSVIHAHTHIVNHKFLDEKKLINEMKFKKYDLFTNTLENTSYIMYISNDNKCYISTSFDKKSQLMRCYISKDLDILNKYDWKKYYFDENIKLTICKIKTIENEDNHNQ